MYRAEYIQELFFFFIQQKGFYSSCTSAFTEESVSSSKYHVEADHDSDKKQIS